MEVYFIDIATTLLREAGVAGDMLHLLSTCMVVACALFVAWLLFWLLTHYLIPVVEKFTNFTSASGTIYFSIRACCVLWRSFWW